jgi:two-component system, NarL family, sensor kinase
MPVIDTGLVPFPPKERMPGNSGHREALVLPDIDVAEGFERQLPLFIPTRARSFVRLSGQDLLPSPLDDSALLQELADAFSAAVAILDASGHIVIVNRAWRSMADAALRPQVGDRCEAIALLSGKGRTAHRFAGQLRRVLAGRQSKAARRFVVKRGQALRHYEMRALPLTHSEAGHVIVVNEDVSMLHDLRRDKQRLSKQLVRSEEQERERIAREMHDSTLQDLVGIGLHLRRLGHSTGDAPTDEIVADIREILQRAQRDMRTMSYLLHPPMLDEAGLTAALASMIRGLSQRMGIRIDFEPRLDRTRFPRDAEMALYRIVQEALINVHRHAHATKVVVRYGRAEDELVVEVEDDGIGFGSDDSAVSLGVGINGMRARLRLLKGTLAISRLDRGTLLRATIPIATGATEKGNCGATSYCAPKSRVFAN